MSTAATVLVCVLNLLGRTQASFPPIQLVETPPPQAHPKVEAYISEGGIINLVTTSVVFQEAAEDPDRCRMPAMKKLASILIHEERHIKYGDDEDGAYHAQLIALTMLGLPPDSNVYVSVQKSMLAVLKAKRRQPAGTALEDTAARNAAPPKTGATGATGGR